MHIVTRGLVLRETAYKEADKILTVLTPDEGKRTVKARGCRGKGNAVSAAAQLLVYSDMTLVEYRDYYTLTEASTIQEFRLVREDLEKLALGSYFAEVTEAVAEEGVPQGELLSLALNCLYALDRLDKPLRQVKAAFELRLACVVGYEPMLDACAVCGKEPEEPRFNLSEGVVRCAGCRDETGEGISMPLTSAALDAMRTVAYGEAKKMLSFRLDENSLRLMADCCEAYLMTQLERGFRTLDFYKTLQIGDKL